ncbi:cell envelope integrity protein TolA [bacterium]|nr:cell envelope integrity protein TolA [bacterium]
MTTTPINGISNNYDLFEQRKTATAKTATTNPMSQMLAGNTTSTYSGDTVNFTSAQSEGEGETVNVIAEADKVTKQRASEYRAKKREELNKEYEAEKAKSLESKEKWQKAKQKQEKIQEKLENAYKRKADAKAKMDSLVVYDSIGAAISLYEQEAYDKAKAEYDKVCREIEYLEIEKDLAEEERSEHYRNISPFDMDM